jgi:hypothetical protein
VLDTDAVREHLLGPRRAVIEATLARAGRVADGWTGDRTADRAAVADAFEAVLAADGLLGHYPTVLAECVAAAGGELRAEPVPAPPYVVVTSTGVLLRATLAEGRLVVELTAFAVERGADGPWYVRGPTEPEAAVTVVCR